MCLLLLAGKLLLIHSYICWNTVLFFICCERQHQFSPHLCRYKMLRMKWGIQKCPQNGEKISTPPPLPSRTPRPRRGDWCLELNCRPPHEAGGQLCVGKQALGQSNDWSGLAQPPFERPTTVGGGGLPPPGPGCCGGNKLKIAKQKIDLGDFWYPSLPLGHLPYRPQYQRCLTYACSSNSCA